MAMMSLVGIKLAPGLLPGDSASRAERTSLTSIYEIKITRFEQATTGEVLTCCGDEVLLFIECGSWLWLDVGEVFVEKVGDVIRVGVDVAIVVDW